MRKGLLALALLVGGLITPQLALANPYLCTPILGMEMNGNGSSPSQCYLLTINSDGSINVVATTSPAPIATTNDSGTITAGGTFQTIAAASTSRKSLEFQNICNKSGNCTNTTDLCYLYIAASGSGTTANSIVLTPGQYYGRSSGSIPSDAISGTCDSTGDKFYASVQ